MDGCLFIPFKSITVRIFPFRMRELYCALFLCIPALIFLLTDGLWFLFSFSQFPSIIFQYFHLTHSYLPSTTCLADSWSFISERVTLYFSSYRLFEKAHRSTLEVRSVLFRLQDEKKEERQGEEYTHITYEGKVQSAVKVQKDEEESNHRDS